MIIVLRTSVSEKRANRTARLDYCPSSTDESKALPMYH
jgi:hypothetical protein